MLEPPPLPPPPSPPATPRSTLRRLAQGLVSATAIVVSVSALALSFYEVQLMREMQRKSAWPYVTVAINESGARGISIVLTNGGTGPAIISGARLQGPEGTQPLWGRLTRELDLCKATISNSNTLSDLVLVPGETLVVFEVANDTAGLKRMRETMGQLQLEICYHSVYDEQWTVARSLGFGAKTQHAEGCQLK